MFNKQLNKWVYLIFINKSLTATTLRLVEMINPDHENFFVMYLQNCCPTMTDYVFEQL